MMTGNMSEKPASPNPPRILRKAGENHSAATVRTRRKAIEKDLAVSLENVGHHRLHPEALQGNIENLVGAAQIPIGLAGPLLVEGEHARGSFIVPFATTEGALVDSYARGMAAITRAGGVRTSVLKSVMHITPLFLCERASEAISHAKWAEKNFERIKKVAEATTTHGKLRSIEPLILGRNLHLQFNYDTGDAMGLNMINIATERACAFIQSERGIGRYYLRVNLSADKKASHRNFVSGYGKEVLAEAVLPRKIVARMLHTTPEELKDFWKAAVTAGMKAGITGVNAHIANGLTALFIATGQDVAQVVNSAVGILDLDLTKEGDLYASLHLPNLVVGTVGGGTGLPTQRECLELMGCYGGGGVGKFAEITAGMLLAGEISLCAALTNGDFSKIHEVKHAFTKTLIEDN